MTIKLLGTLTAAHDDGTLDYLLLPYGEVGRTNVGRLTASAGSVTIPDDLSSIVGNLEHDPRFPVSKPVTIEETDAGLVASVRPLDTTAGSDLRIEASEGVRTGISVELDNAVIRAGVLVSSTLSGYGHVARSAFPSAQITAADVGDLVDNADADLGDVAEAAADEAADEVEDVVAEVIETVLDEAAETDPTDSSTITEGTEGAKGGTTVTARLAPKPARKPGMAPAGKGGDTTAVPVAAQVFASLAAAGAEPRKVLAALDQVAQADIFDVVNQPQWMGELWSGVAYEPDYIPLLNSGDITASKVQGWRFKEDGDTIYRPKVDDWVGAGTDVPSNEVKAEMDEQTISRLAAGWNVDRIHRDFPNPEFWAAFMRYGNESYLETIDGKVREYVLDADNASQLVIPAAQLAALTATAPRALVEIVLGARYAKRTLRAGRVSFAVLADDLYDEWLFITSDEAPANFKATLGMYSAVLEDLTILNDDVPAGTCAMGVKAHATLHQLGGSTPLRVSTEDVAKGNLTEALFGYWSIFQHNQRGLLHVSKGA